MNLSGIVRFRTPAVHSLGWALLTTLVILTIVPARTQERPYPSGSDPYGYGQLSEAERAGRDTWYFWTGGNEKFWVDMAALPDTHVNLLAYVDSRLHGERFRTLGAITQPGCRAATSPDQYGLWMDQCDQPPVPGIPGASPRASWVCAAFRIPTSIPRSGTRRRTSRSPARVGFVSEGEVARRAGTAFDTTRPGNGNSGHLYGVQLTPAEKKALIEFLKTL